MPQLAKRVQAAAGLGFRRVVVPSPAGQRGGGGVRELRGAAAAKVVGADIGRDVAVVPVASVHEALEVALV